MQYAIIEGGALLDKRAFGLADREAGIAMTVDTPINVASISKSFTALGTMALFERSNLDLDGPIRLLMSDNELHDKIFLSSRVSPRMLLSHTSGLSGPSVPVTPMTEALPGIADILLGNSSVSRAVMERPAGSGYAYSGAGFLVLQQVIEDLSQEDFASFMHNNVLRPLNMTDSTFVLGANSQPRTAVYYRGDGRRREPYHLPGAAGGLYSTASDMAKFVAFYARGGDLVGQPVLSPDEFERMLNPAATIGNAEGQPVEIHYALGHHVYESPEVATIVFHAGGNPGLRALYVVAIERGVGFFAVANNDRGSDVLAAFLERWGKHYDLTVHEHF